MTVTAIDVDRHESLLATKRDARFRGAGRLQPTLIP
jgi:hypothetical protein